MIGMAGVSADGTGMRRRAGPPQSKNRPKSGVA